MEVGLSSSTNGEVDGSLKLAIVGTSARLTDNEERDIRQTIALLLKDYDDVECTVISGGAKGVDSIALEVAKGLGFKTEEYRPTAQNWKSFKERNLEIAVDCSELFCLSIPVHTRLCYHHKEPQTHEKTAGCWTLNQVYELGKPTRLLVMPTR